MTKIFSIASLQKFCLFLFLGMLSTPGQVIAGTSLVFNTPQTFTVSVYGLNSDSTTGKADYHLTPQSIGSVSGLTQADRGPDGRIWGVNNSAQLYAYQMTQTQTVWQQVATGLPGNIPFSGCAWSPEGNLFLASLSTIYQFDPSSGVVAGTTRNLSLTGGALPIRGMDFSPSGVLYAADFTNIYTIDLTSGIGTSIAQIDTQFSAAGNPIEMDYGDDGIIRILSLNEYIYSYNTQSGTGAWSSWRVNYPGLVDVNTIASVPEPSSLVVVALMGVGLLAAKCLRLRSTRS